MEEEKYELREVWRFEKDTKMDFSHYIPSLISAVHLLSLIYVEILI